MPGKTPTVPSISDVPRSTRLGLDTLYAAMQMLFEAGDFIPVGIIHATIEKNVLLSRWDMEKTASGNPRWKNQLQIHSLYAVKAGLLAKDRKKGWSITPEGIELLRSGEKEDFFGKYWQERLNYVHGGR